DTTAVGGASRATSRPRSSTTLWANAAVSAMTQTTVARNRRVRYRRRVMLVLRPAGLKLGWGPPVPLLGCASGWACPSSSSQGVQYWSARGTRTSGPLLEGGGAVTVAGQCRTL